MIIRRQKAFMMIKALVHGISAKRTKSVFGLLHKNKDWIDSSSVTNKNVTLRHIFVEVASTTIGASALVESTTSLVR